MNTPQLGIGMTSPRTRTRMVDRLREKGIADARVLAAMAELPRHLFVETRWRIALMTTTLCPSATVRPFPSRLPWRG